ncbi:hypothetical protein [Microbacterium sp. NIBRBAC000506063]|uniref:hypothetical protein n=1 Tax=Microbacterium sp. NIBRBAC000506063 TaxID=2734618 RepID=UPI001BB5F084|nr:hypothetical protein [Microbacterium sp. NIBRBAC000506063]QTV80561.1 hypothetical protein KAE78_06820 [Microbacterium sp. NIBRBAC000506063]
MENFGITEGNRDQFISVRDYLYAQPMNGKYAKWVRDRVSALMVFTPFAQHFDAVHYQVFQVDRGLRIVPISEQARRAGASMEGIVAVAADRGALTVTRTTWQSEDAAKITVAGDKLAIGRVTVNAGYVRELLIALARRRSHVLREAPPEAGRDDAQITVIMMNPDGARPAVAEAFITLGHLPSDDPSLPRCRWSLGSTARPVPIPARARSSTAGCVR